MRLSSSIRLISAVALAGAALVAVSGPAPAAGVALQPGSPINTSVGGCTANFVYDGTGPKAGHTYIGTAAHCVSSIGQPVHMSDTGETFGDVAAIGDANNTNTDWSLIEVRTAFLPRLSAAMKGNSSYPKGVTTYTETAVGDPIQLSGYGIGFSVSGPTREKRVGSLTFDNAETHGVAAALIFGDSGGPLVHVLTGKAWGIVSRLCSGVCEETGPTVEGILAKTAAAGFPVTVRTV